MKALNKFNFTTLVVSSIFISTLIVSCSSTRQLNGQWNGIGYQIDGSQWEVDLTVKNRDITIDYPTLNCGGEWRIAKKMDEEVEFKELILYGINYCDQGVEVHVKKISKVEIEVNYYLREYYPNKPIATATLTKMKR